MIMTTAQVVWDMPYGNHEFNNGGDRSDAIRDNQPYAA